MELCSICGAGPLEARAYPISAVPGNLKFDSIQICNACGFGRVCPMPTQPELDQYYEGGTYWQSVGNSRVNFMHQLVQSLVRVQRIAPNFAGRSALRVLDVGAGSATILTALLKRLSGVQLGYSFVEPDEASAHAVLQRHPDAAKRVSSLGDDHTTYDVVFVNHVLEHVCEPAGFLELIFGKLAKGGLAYVEVPNSDYRFKSNVFPHTLFFTQKSLRLLAAKVGYEVLEVRVFGNVSSLAPGGLAMRLRNKIASVFFRGFVALGIERGAVFCDRQVFGYRDADDGIWLRAVLRRPQE